MTKPEIGATAFHTETIRIRNAANIARDALQRIMEGNLGPLATQALIAQIAVQIGIIIDATANIQEIGREAKKKRTTTNTE
jgi:hypothetical protein